MQEFHYRCRVACLQHLADQGLRHAVAMALDIDVIVDVHLDGLEMGHLIVRQRQRHNRAGASISRKVLARLPGSFWNSLSLSLVSRGAMATFTSRVLAMLMA